MTHRSRYKGRTIPIGCDAPYHHEEEDYTERGYHFIRNWPLDRFWQDGKPKPDRRRPVQIASNTAMSLKDPMRPAVRRGMTVTLRFKCPCGAKREPNSGDLLAHAELLLQERGTEAWVNIRHL